LFFPLLCIWTFSSEQDALYSCDLVWHTASYKSIGAQHHKNTCRNNVNTKYSNKNADATLTKTTTRTVPAATKQQEELNKLTNEVFFSISLIFYHIRQANDRYQKAASRRIGRSAIIVKQRV